ncbi:hypothetical protein EUBSIR_01021 [[Eubacterium] siraeum DSM 15702]|uniref:Uncharacterized protein n=1 Tax=[Eubacterium] siraeum DSM 15702 TaxID=428128 RepID=B0MMH2_9FIRM|nr:hypothetical protein EUBSIR_01021 [[Eubacterium] siraeum DSM 15702]
MSFSYNLLRRIVPLLQSVDKPLCFLKMGSQGRSPRQGLGAVAPVKSPFPGERGQGDRDNKSEVYFKNRLFLQTGRRIVPPLFSYPLGIFDEKTPPELQKSLTIPKLDSIII